MDFFLVGFLIFVVINFMKTVSIVMFTEAWLLRLGEVFGFVLFCF